MPDPQEPPRVSKLMTRDVVTLSANDKLSIADDVMRLGRIRHMPVLDDDGTLIGVLSQRDLFRGALARSLGYGEHAQDKLLAMLFVKEVMTPDPATISADADSREAARIMLERKIGCLIVVDPAGRIEGILTESDFARAFAESASNAAGSAS